jgi:hypothetical protein
LGFGKEKGDSDELHRCSGPLIRGVKTDGKTESIRIGAPGATEMDDTQMSSTLKAAITL